MMVSASAASPFFSSAPSDRPSEVAASCASDSSWRCRCVCALRRWIAWTPISATMKIAEIAEASCRASVMPAGLSITQLPIEALHQQVPVADLARRAAAAAHLDPYLLVVEAVDRDEIG